MPDDTPSPHATWPAKPIDRFVEPVARFLHVQSASGVVLLAFTLAALALANSPVREQFLALWKTQIGLSIGDWDFRHPLKHWINDGLMVIFFFVVGLEVKRELVLGELRGFRTAALPIAAAMGGMIAPAAIYLALQWGQGGQHGWGIPMATDIAFVVGCLALLGERVPRSLRILLLSLAIVDDVGAILVIAIGYTSQIHLVPLAGGVLGIGLVMLLARLGVRSVPMYVLVGVGVWFGFHESGVHATIAGVILGLLTPVRPWVSEGLVMQLVRQAGDFLEGGAWPDEPDRHSVLRSVERAARETISPLERLEAALHPWVSFVIMPLFAFANAGVSLKLAAFADPVALAVLAGLAVGKPLGIVSLSWVAVRTGLATLAPGLSWRVLTAGGVLAGIGFTMSLFIAGLALNEQMLDSAKVGILTASTVCAGAGMVLLIAMLPKSQQQSQGA
jgi:NhaA family Na+:H+ antiporter